MTDLAVGLSLSLSLSPFLSSPFFSPSSRPPFAMGVALRAALILVIAAATASAGPTREGMDGVLLASSLAPVSFSMLFVCLLCLFGNER